MQASLNAFIIYITCATIRVDKVVQVLFVFFRDTYDEAEYFTYNRKDNECHCKPDMDLALTRKDKKNRVSGNVKCDDSSDRCDG